MWGTILAETVGIGNNRNWLMLTEKSRELSVSSRIKLARKILETVEGTHDVEPPVNQTKGLPVEQLIGLAAGKGAPPTDEDVARWIDEHRMEKYGR